MTTTSASTVSISISRSCRTRPVRMKPSGGRASAGWWNTCGEGGHDASFVEALAELASIEPCDDSDGLSTRDEPRSRLARRAPSTEERLRHERHPAVARRRAFSHCGKGVSGTMDAVRFFHDPETARQVRGVLDDAGFTLDALTERLGPHVFAHLSGGARAVTPGDACRRRTRHLAAALRHRRAGFACFGAEGPCTRARRNVRDRRRRIGERRRGGVADRVGPLGGPEHWVVAHDFAPTRGRPIRPTTCSA